MLRQCTRFVRVHVNAPRIRRALISTKAEKITIRDVLNKALDDELARDKNVIIIGEEVGQYQGAYKITKNLIQKYGPERVIDTPITEMGFAGIAVGAAFAGLKPICEFMTFNFSMQAIDHVVNSAAKTRYMSGGEVGVPIVFRGPNGAAAGVAAQHSQDLTSWYGQIPGLKVVAPWSPYDHKGLLRAAVADPDPVVFLENEILYNNQFDVDPAFLDPDFTLEIGKAHVEREGTDITFVAATINVGMCLEVAKLLEKDNISAEVINIRSIRPLDIDCIAKSVKKTNKVITVESGFPCFGLGSEICARLVETCFDYLDAPVTRVTTADVPTPYSEPLEKLWAPNISSIYTTAINLLKSVNTLR